MRASPAVEIPARLRAKRGDSKNLLRRTISANSLSGSGSCEGDTTTSDSMKERLRKDSMADGTSPAVELVAASPAVRPLGPPPALPPPLPTASPPSLPRPHAAAMAAQPDEDSDSSQDSDGVPNPRVVAAVERANRRGSLKVSGEALLGFLGFRRKGSAGASAAAMAQVSPREVPKRMIVGQVLVSRQRNEFVQRSLKQDGKLVMVTRLNMNKVDFVIDLSLITLVETRTEKTDDGTELQSVAVTFGRELALLSAGTGPETDDLRQLLLGWARFYGGGAAVESPRGSPRRGQLRGYLLRVHGAGRAPERVWASQLSGDVLSLSLARGRDVVASVDMSQCGKCSFDRVLLQFVLHEGDKTQHILRCETEEAFVYWRSAVLKYCVELRPPPVSQKISLNYGGAT